MKFGKPKIIVLKMKDLIKSGVIGLAAIVLIVLLVYFLVPKKPAEELRAYVPGTYSAQIILHNKPVDVLVTVSEDRITDVKISLPATEKVFYPLFEPTMASIKTAVIEKQSLAYKTTPENEFTARILLHAIQTALDKAGTAEATGSEIQ